MTTEENWFKFIISGRVEDYLKYINSCKTESSHGGEHDSIHNGRTCNQRNEYWG